MAGCVFVLWQPVTSLAMWVETSMRLSALAAAAADK